MSDTFNDANRFAVKRSVLIVINSLHSGGAEKTCIELARYLRQEYELEVVSLIIGGPAEQQLRSLGVKVTVMHAGNLWQKLMSCLRLAKLLRRKKPEAVITFLYIADLVAGAMARILVPRTRIFWNIRNNVLARTQIGTSSYAVARINAFLSRMIPDVIVYCSGIARAQHESIGFQVRRGCVVENSASSVTYMFSLEKRTNFRLGRFEDDYIFLFVGRFDSVKRVDVYIHACVDTYRKYGGNVRFFLAGRGMDAQNQWLKAAVDASGFPERFELLGYVDDPQAIYSAADCLIVTSESEGSPNTVYEAIATRLQTVIFATIGTEHIEGWGLHRMETRSLDRLIEVMRERVVHGAPASSQRFPCEEVTATSEHPLVTYYRGVLPCG